jgi:hypothetical protein
MIQSVSSQLIGQFAKALEAEIASDNATEEDLTAEEATPAAPKPQAISGFSLFFAALGSWFKGLFRK